MNSFPFKALVNLSRSRHTENGHFLVRPLQKIVYFPTCTSTIKRDNSWINVYRRRSRNNFTIVWFVNCGPIFTKHFWGAGNTGHTCGMKCWNPNKKRARWLTYKKAFLFWDIGRPPALLPPSFTARWYTMGSWVVRSFQVPLRASTIRKSMLSKFDRSDIYKIKLQYRANWKHTFLTSDTVPVWKFIVLFATARKPRMR